MKISRKELDDLGRRGARIVVPIRPSAATEASVSLDQEIEDIKIAAAAAVSAAEEAISVATAAREQADAACKSLAEQMRVLTDRQSQQVAPSQAPSVVVNAPVAEDIAAARQAADTASGAADSAQKMVADAMAALERMAKSKDAVRLVPPPSPSGYRFKFERDPYGRITHCTVEVVKG